MDAATCKHKITMKKELIRIARVLSSSSHLSSVCAGVKQTSEKHAPPAPSFILWDTRQPLYFNLIWIIPVPLHSYQVCLMEKYFKCRGENYNCYSTRIQLIKCNKIIPWYVVNKCSIIATHPSNQKIKNLLHIFIFTPCRFHFIFYSFGLNLQQHNTYTLEFILQCSHCM